MDLFFCCWDPYFIFCFIFLKSHFLPIFFFFSKVCPFFFLEKNGRFFWLAHFPFFPFFFEESENLNRFKNTHYGFAYNSATKYQSQQQGCYILENTKKHPISGDWYTPMEKVLKAELCFKVVLNGYIL